MHSFLPMDQFFREMRRVQRDLDRVWGAASQSRSLLSSYPALNLQEDGDHLYIEAELPGYQQDDLQVYVVGPEQLVLKGERKAANLEKAICHRQERSFGKFTRTLTLPAAVDSDKVEAKLENGILKLRLAKNQSAKAKRIAVSG